MNDEMVRVSIVSEDRWFRVPERRRLGAATPPLRIWHRTHADRIVAEVAPVDGLGTWRACAWRDIGQARDSRQGEAYSLLVDAHAAADAITRSSFAHACDGRCSGWHPIERRVNP
jgi:hypothetical protein